MNESQLEILEKISVIRGKGPDLLMMTVGGNDAGYSEILNNLLSRDTSTMFNSMEMRLFYVAHQLERIGVKLKEEIRPTQVVVPHYFDLIRNELGVVDSNCSDLKNIPVESLRVAERNILRRVNRLITDKGRRHSWTVIDEVPKLFKTGGICSKTSLIRNTSDSLRLQGDTLGAFHPIEEAHRSIADLVWRKLNFRQLMLI
uniref:SGNH hydrolase-type esterase domain-containing protein n=1 Tax=Acrobeloides nanus TaxID=290746 RepID=A0A914EFG8_9BILA